MSLSNIKYILFVVIGFFVLSSCEDDILNQLPKDQISSNNYWKTPADFKLYLNQFYPDIPSTEDYSLADRILLRDLSDNVVRDGFVHPKMEGTRVVPSSGGGWDFELIRNINNVFENFDTEKITEAPQNFDQYIGEAHFFRAYFYFRLVENFGDVPYYSETLDMDSEGLYDPRTPRQEVIDNILADLDNAIEKLESGPIEGGTRVNREVAQLFKARVSLFEGTWEKYHEGTVFGVSNSKSNEYLQIAANAALSVIESGHYDVYSTGDTENDYYNLFNRVSYAGNPEVLLWEKFSVALDKVHRRNKIYFRQASRDRGVTKGLVDEYLCIDGQPTAVSPLYQGDDTIMDVLENRDPRMSQSIFKPGDPWWVEPYPSGDTTNVYTRSRFYQFGSGSTVPTAYEWRKGYRPDLLQGPDSGGRNDFTGDIFFRYGEALLIYAEAKAELGTISQGDIDMTINKLRDRVGMPHLQIGNIVADPDWTFPELSPILNEIRRERRIEMAGEIGHRWDDLRRWRAHNLFVGKRFLGAKFDPEMYPELVDNPSLHLTSDGYIDYLRNRLPNGYGFNPDRDYLDPIPISELTLNENLEQNPGW